MDVEREVEFEIPDGIIAHLTRQCGGNVHDHHVVDITSGSFERETVGANPHSGAYNNDPDCAARNAADLEVVTIFGSAYRRKEEDIAHTRNNWLCYDFKERRIVPTHFTVRTHSDGPGYSHMRSWLVETSADGASWREVAREENNNQLNGKRFAGTFAVTGGGECRFIRLVNIGRTHRENDRLAISGWEIFGILIESIADSSDVAFAFRWLTMAPVHGASPLPTAHPCLWTRELWDSRHRLTTVDCKRTFSRSLPTPAVLLWSPGCPAHQQGLLLAPGIYPLFVCRYSNEIDHFTLTCAALHAWQSFLIFLFGARFARFCFWYTSIRSFPSGSGIELRSVPG
jgi:hypothetical protein